MSPSSDLLEQAQSDYLAGNSEAALRTLESGAGIPLFALCKVRQILRRHALDQPVDGPGLLALLGDPFPNPRLEADRHFARGWLFWLVGQWHEAEQNLQTAAGLLEAANAGPDQCEAAYWLARVQILVRRPQPLAAFEAAMRSRGGSPQATCWYMDLLWRSGQQDRAEQIWKTVRNNRKMVAVEEAPLLEARILLRQGEIFQAEGILEKTAPGAGPLQVERGLLRTWLHGQRGQLRLADSFLRQAEKGPYPACILRTWRDLFHRCHVAPLENVWRKALELQSEVGDGNHWRTEVKKLQDHSYLAGLAQVLLAHEAGLRGDAAALAELLQEPGPRKTVPGGPPDLVVRAVESVHVANPGLLGLTRSIAGWLQAWPVANLSSTARRLAQRVGLLSWNATMDEPPVEIPSIPWFLHQAALALGRDNAAEALRWVRRALQHDPDLRQAGPNAEAVLHALPELEHKIQLQALAQANRFTPHQPLLPADVLAGALDALNAQAGGQPILVAAAQGDLSGAEKNLMALVQRYDLSPPCAHHLALFFFRTALCCEDQADGKTADIYWRLAWPSWLRVLTPELAQDPALGANQRLLLNRLLDIHRRYIHDYLSRNAVEDARRHWSLVESLPATVETVAPALLTEVQEGVARLRETLVTDYLTATREVLKYGAAAVGWRANYEAGLQYLRRLLSLDHDNPRLLTALVDICGDWFLDCYNNEDPRTLGEQLGRYYPFALKLARMVDSRLRELAARAAVAEFYKFRGLMAPNRVEKMAIYREALRFNPDNTNVRDLLAGLEEREESS
jgi:tetratricopeptide (TPR) repeat protein